MNQKIIVFGNSIIVQYKKESAIICYPLISPIKQEIVK